MKKKAAFLRPHFPQSRRRPSAGRGPALLLAAIAFGLGLLPADLVPGLRLAWVTRQ